MADPINITRGTLFFQRQELGSIGFIGDGPFSMHAQFGNDETYYPGIAAAPMPAGTLVSLSQHDSFTNAPDSTRSVRGVYLLGSTAYLLDSLDFRVDDLAYVRVPSDSTGRITTTSTTRFNFHMFLTGTSNLGARVEQEFVGRGSARLHTLDNAWFASEYNFDDQSPVPEPGTLLLFATGAAAVTRRRRR
ncbi:MAG TPA: PEP-CTERM sorting domain-containing protein [Vicinamibacterales bacterium]